MKTFAEFQEAAIAVPAITGLISKFALPAAATIIGGLGTYYQIRKAKKARKPYEKRTGFKSKETSSKESKEDMLKRVREAQARIQSQLDTEQKMKKANQPFIEPKRGEVIDEDRKKFDKFMKDARNKKGEEKLDVLRKATKVHKELPPEDKG